MHSGPANRSVANQTPSSSWPVTLASPISAALGAGKRRRTGEEGGEEVIRTGC